MTIDDSSNVRPAVSSASKRPLRMCIVDMNDGHENQAIRCFRLICSEFHKHARKWNPELELELSHVSVRDKDEAPPRDCDLYVSSGGPGSPFDGDGQPWVKRYYDFLDDVAGDNARRGASAKAVFGVCYSFEMIVRHFDVATMAPRASRKFGVMPIYTTRSGREHPLLSVFGDRLFAFEHRNWEAIDLNEKSLTRLGGKLLARESREGQDDKGVAILGLDVTPGIETVQFHPEADRAGVVAWVRRPDQSAAFREAYGDETYERMLKTLDDPTRIARTFSMLIPGWMTRKFNAMAAERGWREVGPPVQDMAAFGTESARAQGAN